MKTRTFAATATLALLALLASTARAQTMPVIPNPQPAADSTDPVGALVGRLDLERYKATIKGLTQFGDRRQGTARNRAAVDWIEAQLKSYGCTPTERITYDFQMAPPRPAGSPAPAPRPRVAYPAEGGSHVRGTRAAT